MSDPFYPAKSGDPILADMWNNMQIKLRDEVRTHTHRGADDGKQLDGDSIVPTATLRVNRVDASVALTVKSIDVLTRLTELGTSITGLGNAKLNVTGGGITGALTVTGNLGVGTTAPGSKLDIQGTARTGTHGNNRTLYVTGDFAPDDGVEFRHTNGTQGVGFGHNTVYATGSNADQDLNLKARGSGSVRVTRGALVPTLGNAPTAGIQFPPDPGGGSGDNAFIRYYSVSGDRSKLMIGCDNDADDSIGLWQSGAERLTVINGRVGVGTADPQGALDVRVAGTAGDWDRLVVNATTNWGDAAAYVTIGAGGATGIMVNNPHVSWLASEARASIRYGRSGGVASGRFWDAGVRAGNAFSVALDNNYHALWLSADGSVGVGTSTPGARLDVQGGNLRVSGAIVPSVGSSASNGIQFPADPGGGGGDQAFIRYYAISGETTKLLIGCDNDADDAISFWQYGAERMTLWGANVGIGTITPQVPLHVQQRGPSGIRLQEHGNTGRYLNIHLEGQGTAVFYHHTGVGQYMAQDGYWRLNSDRALKKNISGLEGVLERLLALQPVGFDWKATGTRSLGLVAQDVEPLFPELVSEVTLEHGPRIKGVAYEALGVLAIAAIQELKRQYDEKLKALEARIQALPAR
ncbi:tail fiber domain-containing protein [Pyxidicoccus sp. 3LFB2]